MNTEQILLIKQIITNTSINIISEYQYFKILDNLLWLVVLAIATFIGLFSFKKFRQYVKEKEYDDGESLFFSIMFSYVVGVLSIIPMINIGGTIELIYTPIGYLISYIISQQ